MSRFLCSDCFVLIVQHLYRRRRMDTARLSPHVCSEYYKGRTSRSLALSGTLSVATSLSSRVPIRSKGRALWVPIRARLAAGSRMQIEPLIRDDPVKRADSFSAIGNVTRRPKCLNRKDDRSVASWETHRIRKGRKHTGRGVLGK